MIGKLEGTIQLVDLSAFDEAAEQMATVPLHADYWLGENAGDDWWFGCRHPERPADVDVLYDLRCRACMMHARAALHRGELRVGAGYSETLDAQVTIEALVEGAWAWHCAHPEGPPLP